MISQSWSHGYNVQVPYTFGYYRETDPVWLDFATLITGFSPPSKRNERPLRYLDMGCGQGFGLCLTASLHPDMEFVGIDFNPAHIAHARALADKAGLGNVKFVEGDFVELGNNWPKELGQFDYVVIHGVWSWISSNVRKSAVDALKKCLVPGGLVYNSYNAQPGWHAGSILRELLTILTHSESGQAQLEALRRSIGVIKQLREAGAIVFNAYPGLTQRLNMLDKHDLRYVANEYVNEAHTIFWGHEVAFEMAHAKLTFIASATLPENFLPALLPPQQAEIINRYTQPLIRQLLIDVTINQAFRRDIYQYGVVPAIKGPQIECLEKMRVIGLRSDKRDAKFSLSFGEVSGREEVYIPLIDMVDRRAYSVSEIMQSHPEKLNIGNLVQALAITAWDQRLTFAQPDGYFPKSAHAFNKAILTSLREGRFYDWLAAPLTYQGIAVPLIDRFILAAIIIDGHTPDPDVISPVVLNDLERLGLPIEHEGKTLVGDDKVTHIRKMVSETITKKLSLWKHLGIVV